MPYFVYRVEVQGVVRRLDCLDSFASFKPASEEAKRLRRELELAQDEQIRVIFAETELHAEDLLSQVREAGPMTGEDG